MIKGCPFCGREPYINTYAGGAEIVCYAYRKHGLLDDPHAIVYGDSVEDAIRKWNKRC